MPAEQHAKKISGPGKSRSASESTREEENLALRQVDIGLSVLEVLQHSERKKKLHETKGSSAKETHRRN